MQQLKWESSDSTPAVVPISISEESSKNNAEEIDEVTDAPQGAQGATTINRGAVKAEATKVAKAKSAGKKDAYQTSLGSSIAKNRPKRACTLKRTFLGQPILPPPSTTKATDKICTVLNNPDPVLVPALVPVWEGANMEFPAEILVEPRPRRSCGINSYIADNYVLQSTKIVPKPAVANERRSRSLLVTSKRLHKAQAKAKRPSITTFLKPRVASSKGVKNDVGEPREALIKSQLDSLVSQKLNSDFFPYKDDMSRVLFDKPIVWPVRHLVPTMNQMLTGPGKK